MASKPDGVFSTSSSSSLDPLFLPALLSRLQLRTPLSSLSLDDLLLESPPPTDLNSDPDDDGENLSLNGDDEKHRRRLAREEARLEREIIRIIHSGDADKVLKPNSGQSVAIRDENICFSAHEEPGSAYRIWEWHGHIMFFDDENGYNAEYIYGSYFERLQEKKREEKELEDDVKEQQDEEEEVKLGGLRDLIGDSKDSVGSGGGRVLHRNSLNGASAK